MNTTDTMSQKEVLSTKLIAIKENVTSQDRKDYVKEAGVTEQLIVFYLKGDVRDTDTGLKMLKFFTEKIRIRQEEIINL